MRGPSRRILECGIYLTNAGTEVRASYDPDDLLHSHIVIGIATARAYAEELRPAVQAKGGFEELPLNGANAS